MSLKTINAWERIAKVGTKRDRVSRRVSVAINKSEPLIVRHDTHGIYVWNLDALQWDALKKQKHLPLRLQPDTMHSSSMALMGNKLYAITVGDESDNKS